MTARTVALFVVISLAVSAFGQATRPVAATQSTQTQVGTVTGNDVYVRAGGGTDAYFCTKIHSPSTVNVVSKRGDWYEILPVPGTFSVIDKSYLQVDAAGTTGTVTTDGVYVRPGGDLHTSNFGTIQRKVNKGDQLKVLGQLDKYYKVEPPAGAHFWIHSQFVSLGGEPSVVKTAVVAGRSSTSQPTLAGVTETVPKRTPATGPAPRFASTAEVTAFEVVEKDLLDQFKTKSVEQVDVRGLQAKYKALTFAADSPLKGWVSYRIAFLQSIIDAQSNSDEGKRIVADAMKKQAEIDARLREIKAEPIADIGPSRYDAQGVVMASGLFIGGATGKKYTLRDPVTMRVDAYIQSTAGKYNLEEFVNKHVGIMGKGAFDANLKLNVLEVEEIHILNEKAEIPPPSRPVVDAPPALPKATPPPAVPPKTAMPGPITPAVEAKAVAEPPATVAPPILEPKAEPKIEPKADAKAVEPVTKAEPSDRPVMVLDTPPAEPAAPVEPAAKAATMMAPTTAPAAVVVPAPAVTPAAAPAVAPAAGGASAEPAAPSKLPPGAN